MAKKQKSPEEEEEEERRRRRTYSKVRHSLRLVKMSVCLARYSSKFLLHQWKQSVHKAREKQKVFYWAHLLKIH